MRNIVFVGFMGTGKTTIATQTARALKMRYVSVDDLIEKREKRTINEIFTTDGESYFRDVESEIVRELSGQDGLVIDTGGGVVIREENIAALKSGGTVICLTADEDAVMERTKKYKHRPLLNVEDPKGRIRALLAKRSPLYAKADHCIDTGKLTVRQAVAAVVAIAEGTHDVAQG
jgi:shikimate kinase